MNISGTASITLVRSKDLCNLSEPGCEAHVLVIGSVLCVHVCRHAVPPPQTF